ncbi:hypothetical protein L7F22_027421 [Adiantum nelumboides]|nr:hypothetical protein [Adiantum nelumboides]
MPFGLLNAPATFNRLMEKIFLKHSAYTGVFFDDIIVHSQTLEEHKKHLQSVFDELQANRIFVNKKKSEFFMKEIKYLGHIISKEGIRMDPKKLRVIDEWPEPCSVHELRSFLEYVYNNTIHTSTGKTPFEVIAGRPRLPLILKPHEKISATDEEVRDIRVAFDKIKESIQSAQQMYKRAADKHRKHLQFKEGDWVLLRFMKARLNMTTGKNWKGEQTGHQKYYMKLAKRYYGPFQMLLRINEMAYRFKLPANWHIHDAFHVSLLKPFKGDPPKDPVQEEPPLFDDIEEVLQPEEILRHEENTLCSGKVIRRYLVKFKHYSNEDSKWMQKTQMKDVLPLLQAYKILHGLM